MDRGSLSHRFFIGGKNQRRERGKKGGKKKRKREGERSPSLYFFVLKIHPDEEEGREGTEKGEEREEACRLVLIFYLSRCGL